MRIRKKLLVALAGVGAVATVAVGTGFAGSALLQRAANLAAPSVVSGNSITAVKVVRGTEPVTTQATAFADVPGAATSIRVPRGQRALVLARFSSESYCSDGTDNFAGWCGLRIMIGNAQGQPADDASTPFAFDSDPSGADDFYEGNSMDRSRVLGPGLHTVKVQAAVTSASIFFWLDDWSLTVERVRK